MPKKTIALIRTQQQHYLVKVKGNERKLFEDIEQVCRSEKQLDTYTSMEYNKGREEHRKMELYPASQQAKKKWCGIKSFIRCTRWGKRNGREYETVSYYISDLRISAREFNKGIRSHWTIENCLHWVKDVVFKEDKCRIRQASGAAVFSVIRGFAITCLAQMGDSTTEIMRIVTNKPDQILQLLE
jgi:predicted transposase YbfD/YdcC